MGLPSSTQPAQSSPVQQGRVIWQPSLGHLPASPECPQFPGSLTPVPAQCGKGQMENSSQPAVGTEGAPQLFNLGRVQRGQGCTAGTSIVAKPLHGLLQPWDPKPAGDLWEGGRAWRLSGSHGAACSLGSAVHPLLLCLPSLLSSPCRAARLAGCKVATALHEVPTVGRGAEHVHTGLHTGALWHVGLCSRDRPLHSGMRGPGKTSSPSTHTAAYK